MGIEGSVSSSLSAGSNTVTFPSAGLHIVGIGSSVAANNYLTIALDATRNALIPWSSAVGPQYYSVDYVLKGTTLTVSSLVAATVVFYYSSAGMGGASLDTFAAVVATTTTTASGTATQSFTFPTGVSLRAVVMLALTGDSIEFSTASGIKFTALKVPTPAGLSQFLGIGPINMQTTLSVTFTSTAAETEYTILYYA